ncbi:hypothetical protein D3C76_466770 [compost metagenome]
MNILVTPANNGQWQVRMDQHVVKFRTEADAQRFVATLQARLKAPHSIPQRAAS